MYTVKIKINGDSRWYVNKLTFETLDEAIDYAEDLASRWTAVVDYEIFETVAYADTKF